MSEININLNVKDTMKYLENATNMIHELSDGEYFSGDTETQDLKNQLGMTDDAIEIYHHKNRMPDNLVIPITFIEEDNKSDAKINAGKLSGEIINRAFEDIRESAIKEFHDIINGKRGKTNDTRSEKSTGLC